MPQYLPVLRSIDVEPLRPCPNLSHDTQEMLVAAVEDVRLAASKSHLINERPQRSDPVCAVLNISMISVLAKQFQAWIHSPSVSLFHLRCMQGMHGRKRPGGPGNPVSTVCT